MAEPRFTVIIPALNEEKYLPILLDDLARQKTDNFEVIVVDGKSEDKTVEVAESYKSKLNVRVVVSPERNLSVQRNLGARTAKGDYYLFLDADTRIADNFLEVMTKEVNQNKFLIIFPLLMPINGILLDRVIFWLVSYLVQATQYLSRPIPTGSAYMFQGQYFHFLGGFTEKHFNKSFFPEDQDIVLRASLNGVRARCLRDAKAYFSLRRIQKEGRLRVYWEYFMAGLDTTLKGKVNTRAYKYEMGGHVYKPDIK